MSSISASLNLKNSKVDFVDLKQSILNELNKLREDPTSYIPILEDYIKLFKNNILYRHSGGPIQTQEGPSAFKEAIKFLHRQNPVPKLIIEKQLSQAAEDHVKDLGSKGFVSHESSDGKTTSDRIEEYCEWEGACGENIDVASQTAQDVIVSFIVDDGIPERGHRLNLFKEDFKYIGIAVGSHKDYDTVTVCKFIGNLRQKGTPFFDFKNFKYEYPKNFNSPFNKLNQNNKNNNLNLKNQYQLTDQDAPSNTASVKIVKKIKLFNGRKVNITKKYYTLQDGTQQIVEIEEF